VRTLWSQSAVKQADFVQHYSRQYREPWSRLTTLNRQNLFLRENDLTVDDLHSSQAELFVVLRRSADQSKPDHSFAVGRPLPATRVAARYALENALDQGDL